MFFLLKIVSDPKTDHDSNTDFSFYHPTVIFVLHVSILLSEYATQILQMPQSWSIFSIKLPMDHCNLFNYSDNNI